MKLFTLGAAISANADLGALYQGTGPISQRELEMASEGPMMGDERAAKFKESGGYIVIQKQKNCWEECGRKRGWSGFCSFCSLSNGSPGFCCNPRSKGGCTSGMVKAVRNSDLRSKNHYQCVIPKTMDDNDMTHYAMLDRPNCWSNCGRKRGWAGRCNYCGPNGYCCHADGRGGCTREMSDVLKLHRKRGMRCIVPDVIKNDLRSETKLTSACKDVHKTECRTLADYKGKGMDFESLLDCTRFFPANTCVSVDKITVNSSAKPICTTKITNFCASEDSTRSSRLADRTSDADFASGGQYESWNTFTKEFYEFLRPQWIAADDTGDGTANDKGLCEAAVAGATITLNDTDGSDVLTIAAAATGDLSTTCPNDRADVITLKAIINSVASTHQEVFGVPTDKTLTGSQRAEAMMDAFTDAIDNWVNGDDTITDPAEALESTQIAELQGDAGGTVTGAQTLHTAALASPSFELFSLVVGALDDLTDAAGTSADFPQLTVDPVVSYDQTSLMNMPKSQFDEMIDAIQPGINNAPAAATVKANYQTLLNEAGSTSPVERVFWDFISDGESPLSTTLTTAQKDAIAQAMTFVPPSDRATGDAFCGQLNGVNQALRNIVTDSEADAIMRAIQGQSVAYKNVASLMEVMSFLEDGTAIFDAGATYPTDTITVPTATDAVAAAYGTWDKTTLYGTASIDDSVEPAVAADGFDMALETSNYYTIAVNAVTADTTNPATFPAADGGTAFTQAVRDLLAVNGDALTSSQTDAEQCVDNANGAPQIYKDIMYDYLTKVESPGTADFPQTAADWAARAAHADCATDEATIAALATQEMKTSCRLATCIESMSHVTFANPAGEACDNIKGCIMVSGDTAAQEAFGAMCDKPDYKHGLNQVLTAVAVLDADPANGLADINSLFDNADNTAKDFSQVNYQTGTPLVDTSTCTDGSRRTMDQSIRDQENRKIGIITGGFVVPGLSNVKASQKAQETWTVSWWDTTAAWTTTNWFDRPKNNKNKNKNKNRGLETVDEAPGFDSFNDVMNAATANAPSITWNEASDEAKTAFCTVNPCIACDTALAGTGESKVVSTALANGQTSSECVCPANVGDDDGDGTVNDLAAATPVELAQPIYGKVVLDYFTNWEISPATADQTDPEKFRPDELQCIATALSDLPRPEGLATAMPMSAALYMTHTRGLVINHLMNKIYAKGDLDLETRIQGALDEDMFRHNMYFVLETLLQVEKEIRETATANGVDPPDFTALNTFNVESTGDSATLDWRNPEMVGNTDSILSTDYQNQILNGLNGGSPPADIVTAVQGHYQEIYDRTSELTDCAANDKTRSVTWLCDARVLPENWQPCSTGSFGSLEESDQCWLDAMATSTDTTGVCTTTSEADLDMNNGGTDSNCACDRTDITECKPDAPLQIDNSNWNWGSQNPLFGAWGEQWMMDMASLYSAQGTSSGDSSIVLTQAEMCSLEQAISEAMAAGAAGAEGGASNFGENMPNQIANYIANNGGYSQDFADKVNAIVSAAQADGRDEELGFLIDSANGLTQGYAGNWNGNAIDGAGHGSDEYNELYNLIDGMQNGGSWDALGDAQMADGSDVTGTIGFENDPTGGKYGDFDGAAYDQWIQTSLNPDIMGASYAGDNTGDNSNYQNVYDGREGWVSTLTPQTGGTPDGPDVSFGGGGVAIEEEDLAHTQCVMDVQLNILEEWFKSNGVGTDDALLIKNAAKAVLQSTAVNDDTTPPGTNPDLINWFGSHAQSTVATIQSQIAQALDELAVAQPAAVTATQLPEYTALLAQLDLIADLGDPANKELITHDELKALDYNQIIPATTTADTYDPATVMTNLESVIPGQVPADLNDKLTATQAEISSLNRTPTTAPTPTGGTPTAGTPTAGTPTAGTPTAGTPTAGTPTAGTPTAGTPTAGTPTAGTPTAGTPTAGTPTAPAPTPTAPAPTPTAPAPTPTAPGPTAPAPTTPQTGSLQTNIAGTVNTVATPAGGGGGGIGAVTDAYGNVISTGSNGYGSMYGDPHVIIKNPDEPSVCFDVHGMHNEVLNVLSDFKTGLTVNSKLVREGKHIRMAEVFIITPKGDKISLTESGVTFSNNDYNNTYTYDKEIDIQRPDVLLISEPDHKNDNVHVYILGTGDVGVTEFLIVRKRISKHSMKFSIINNEGLSHNLGGVVGQNLIPHDYHIDEHGNIQLQDRVIDANMVEYSAENECYKINDFAATKFLGHSTREFVLNSAFDKFHPSWVNAQLREDLSPK